MANISFKKVLQDEFEHEMATTRKLLERVPMDKADWVPHPKSSPLGKLAIHVAQLSGMGVGILTQTDFSFSGIGQRPEINTAAELVAYFDENVKATHEALEATTDEELAKPWKLSFKDHKIFEGSRAVAFQTIFLNHFIHHRAQLGVYLRLNDVAIPGSYGPSADEPFGSS